MPDAPESSRSSTGSASEVTAEMERLPTQTLETPSGTPSTAATSVRPRPSDITLSGEEPSLTPEPGPPTAPPAPGAPSPFAGLLAEANATPGPLPAPRAHRFTVPSAGRDGAHPGARAGDAPKAGERGASTARLPGHAGGGHPSAQAGDRAKTEVMPSSPPASAAGASTVSMSSPPKPAEERRIGPYRVLEELGSGGMAVVYKAIQPSLDRIVAIKELRAEYVHDRQIAARFAREAASLATLQHGNIVTIFDYLYDFESAHIVMEYVEGIDLFDLLAATDRVPAEIAAIIGVAVAEALEYAHYRGIIHRDIKPSNILVAKNGEVKLMDFGIARDPGNSELTMVGIAVGTPAYMAPEQIRGDRIDFRTDIFALGIVLYEMIGGDKPWPEEEGRSVTVKVLDEDYPPLRTREPSVPPELERIIARCLEKDASKRYRTTHELRRDLELYVQRAVQTDPRGRVVLFLKNRDLVSETDAASFVEPSLLGDVATRLRDQGIAPPPAKALLEPVAVASAVGLAIVLASAALSAFAPYGQHLAKERPRVTVLAPGQETPPAAAETHGSTRARTLTGKEGFVRVVVEPWARVFVDGQFYDVTPFAEPIALPPGVHEISLRNPYFQSANRQIQVTTGKTESLKVSLLPREGGREGGREDGEERRDGK